MTVQDYRSVVSGKKVSDDESEEKGCKPERCCANCRDNAGCIPPRSFECYDNNMKHFVLTPVYGKKRRGRGRSKPVRRSLK